MKTGFPKVLKSGEKFCPKTVDEAVYNTEGYPLSDRIAEHDLHKMKLGVIGDGISISRRDSDNSLIGYIDLLATKFAACINYSAANTCIAKTKTTTGVDSTHPAIATKYIDMSDDLDIILVVGSSNDWVNNVPIESDNNDDLYSYTGALNTIINGLLNKYAGKEIIFITPIHRHYASSDPTIKSSSFAPNDNSNVLGDYVTTMKEICASYSIPVIDLYNTSGIYLKNAKHNEVFTDNAGVQPNKTGQYRLYRRVYSALLSLI